MKQESEVVVCIARANSDTVAEVIEALGDERIIVMRFTDYEADLETVKRLSKVKGRREAFEEAAKLLDLAAIGSSGATQAAAAYFAKEVRALAEKGGGE